MKNMVILVTAMLVARCVHAGLLDAVRNATGINLPVPINAQPPSNGRQNNGQQRQGVLSEEEGEQKYAAGQHLKRNERDASYEAWKENGDRNLAEYEKRMERMQKEQEELARKREAEEAEARKTKEELARKNEEERELEMQKKKEEDQRKGILEDRARLVIAIRSICRDGNDRTSVYLQPETIATAQQFADKPIVTSRVPLYKSISSGSTLLWVMGQFVPSKDRSRNGIGVDIKIKSLGDIGMSEFDYDGVSVQLPENGGESHDMLEVYCTSEGVDDNVSSADAEEHAKRLGGMTFRSLTDGFKSSQADVEVFGISKTFPSVVTSADVIHSLKAKYLNLSVKGAKSTSTAICSDFVGMKCNTTLAKYDVNSDIVSGVVEESRREYTKLDLTSDEACGLVYGGAVEALKQKNEFAAREFEETFATHLMQARADIASGKYKKELEGISLEPGGIKGSHVKGDRLSKELLARNLAAKATLEEVSLSKMRSDAIKQARSTLSILQNQFAERLSDSDKVSVQMKLFDAKALETLSRLKRERVIAKQREKDEAVKAKKANALDF